MKDLRRLVIAFHAVSTSPVMSDWDEYVSHVKGRPARDHNPRGPVLLERLLRLTGPQREETLPRWSRLVTALVSFVDDHNEIPPAEFFVVPQARSLLERLENERCLSIDEQLQIALTEGIRTFDAVLALHLCTRVLARGRDSRLHPDFALSLGERLRRGEAIAPFHPDDARGGDALGDTYHYWANVAAGMFTAHTPLDLRSRLRSECVRGLFYAGPTLMSGVREGVFGNVLFFGNHRHIDHLGLAHGRALGTRMRAVD